VSELILTRHGVTEALYAIFDEDGTMLEIVLEILD
tara:strand:+ start:3047 stop:3151 length:105 start_codon:yes stop_codon:yes gene_type:complete